MFEIYIPEQEAAAYSYKTINGATRRLYFIAKAGIASKVYLLNTEYGFWQAATINGPLGFVNRATVGYQKDGLVWKNGDLVKEQVII